MKRLPAPKGNVRDLKKARQEVLAWATRTQFDPLVNPFVAKLVEIMQEAAAFSGINLYTLFADFSGMLEANLRQETDIFRHRLLHEEAWQDPPEEAARFTRARSRMLTASEKRPAVYQKMNETFLAMIKILFQAAGYGLGFYIKNRQYSPDVIGQAFVACLNPGPEWRAYFPLWDVALADVGARIDIDGVGEQIMSGLALATEQAGVALPAQGGPAWEAWFKTILPYTVPCPLGLDSSAMMLAAAAHFPDWVVLNHLAHFDWPPGSEPDPVVAMMARVNIELYGLNEVHTRYRLAFDEGLDIVREGRAAPRSIESFAPELIYQENNETAAPDNAAAAPPVTRPLPAAPSVPAPEQTGEGPASLQNIFSTFGQRSRRPKQDPGL